MFSFLMSNISRITTLCGECMFNFMRNCQAVFQSNFTILYSYQQYMFIYVVPIFSLFQHLDFETLLFKGFGVLNLA